MQLILAEIEIPVGGDFVNWYMVVKSEIQHVIGRVPAGRDVARHHTNSEPEALKLRKPLRENNSGGILDCVGKGSKLCVELGNF